MKALDKLPSGPKARRDRLVELAADVKSHDIPALVRACETFVRNSPTLATELVEALTARTPDERLGALATRLHASPPPNASKKLGGAIARLVKQHTGARPGPVPPAATVARDPGPLLAEVAARPDDDGPRGVYADWLTERGDPRGELITLQLLRTAATRKREQELIANHRTELLGPFASCAKRTGLKFDRGFLVQAVASADWPAAAENALLERLDLAHHELALDVALASLREISNFDHPIGRLLERAPRLRAVRYLRTYEPHYIPLLTNSAPRSVDDITISTWGVPQTRGGFEALVASPLARDVQRLELRVSWPGEATIAALLPLVPASCTTFVYDVVSHVPMRFELVRRDRRWALSGEIAKLQPTWFARAETELAHVIAGLPPLASASFVVRPDNAHAAIARAVASIPGATVA